jgi:hypothetical protein
MSEKNSETDIQKKPVEPPTEEPYTVLSKGVLLRILVITSLTGMLSPLTANIYLPALNQIQNVTKRQSNSTSSSSIY